MQEYFSNENSCYGLIYVTTNLINGNKYIGKVTYGKYKNGIIKDRRTNYLGSGTILNRAIKKYSVSNFARATLQYCISNEDLNESELYWIDYFGAVNSDIFYNINEGGTGGYCGEEAGKKIGLANKRRQKEGDWSGFKIGVGSKPYAHKISKAKKGKPNLSKRKKVGQFDLNNNLLKSYDAIAFTSNDGFCRSKVSSCCTGKRSRHRGFIWKYLD